MHSIMEWNFHCNNIRNISVSKDNIFFVDNGNILYSKILEQIIFISKKRRSLFVREGITSIFPYAADMCKLIYKINFPSSIQIIGNHAFYCCTNLKIVNFGQSCQLKEIEDYSFAYCEIEKLFFQETCK